MKILIEIIWDYEYGFGVSFDEKPHPHPLSLLRESVL